MSQTYQIEVETVEVTDALNRLASMEGGKGERLLRKMFAQLLREARKRVMQSTAAAIPNDPRKASKAVRSAMYKRLVGGQINILQKRKAGAGSAPAPSARMVRHGGRGGNRRARSARTEQVDGYRGADRGFVLRFLNEGTTTRTTRYGVRGHIEGRRFFKPAGDAAMKQLINEFSKAADEIARDLWG